MPRCAAGCLMWLPAPRTLAEFERMPPRLRAAEELPAGIGEDGELYSAGVDSRRYTRLPELYSASQDALMID